MTLSHFDPAMLRSRKFSTALAGCILLAALAEATPTQVGTVTSERLAKSPSALLSSSVILVTSGGEGARGVLKVDPVTGNQAVLTSGGNFGRPEDLAIRSDGMIFVADGDRFGSYGGRAQVVRVHPRTGAQTVVSAGGRLLDPHGIAIGPDGQIYVADFSGPSGLGGIIEIDPTTGLQTVVFTGGPTPFDLAFENSGDILFGRRSAFGSPLYRLDLPAGSASLLASNVGVLGDIVVTTGKDIFVADGGAFGNAGTVIRVDPASGTTTTISSGGSLGNLTGITQAGEDLLVSQPDSIIRVDPLTGNQEVLATGGLLVDLTGIGVFPELARRR